MKGNTGNVAGKPKGARNKASLLLDRMAARSAGDVLRVVLTKALAGDMAACALVLDRLWPREAPRRPIEADQIAVMDGTTIRIIGGLPSIPTAPGDDAPHVTESPDPFDAAGRRRGSQRPQPR